MTRDPRADFGTAAHWFADLVRLIPADDWEQPGLGEWDVRALVGHTSRSLITVDTYLDQPAERVVIESPEDYYLHIESLSRLPGVAERGRVAGGALGDDPAAAVTDLCERVLARIPVDDPVIETIAGGMRLSDYLPTRTFELVVHGHDIVAATQIDAPALDPDLLTATIGLAGRVAVLSGHGPAVLNALTGRAPLAPGFSVV